MDGLTYALAEINSQIPPQILEATFEPEKYQLSLDELIKQKVLLARVRRDVSLRGGKVLKIPLDYKWCKFTGTPSAYVTGMGGSYDTYTVPPEAREHRDIVAILGMSFPNAYANGSNFADLCAFSNSGGGNTLNNLVTAALRGQTYSGTMSTPNAVLRPGNVIQLTPAQYNYVPWVCLTRIEYDDNFSGMDVSVTGVFGDVCVAATKSYIYNNKIFDIESNVVYRGGDLGVIRELVSDYKDAEEKYKELLLTMGGTEIFDHDRLPNILRRMVPRR